MRWMTFSIALSEARLRSILSSLRKGMTGPHDLLRDTAVLADEGLEARRKTEGECVSRRQREVFVDDVKHVAGVAGHTLQITREDPRPET